MKNGIEAANMLAMWADAEALSTANLIEMVAAACLMKLTPPTGEQVVSFELTQEDFDSVVRDYHFETEYQDGTMKTLLTPINR